MSVMKSPRSIDQLRNALGRDAEEVLDTPGGLRDMVMQRLMLSAFPEGVTTEAVASGAFGRTMRATISKMNANGSLAKVLTTPERNGQEVVNELLKVARVGEGISDATLKGKTGLAPAGFAAAAGVRMFTEPISFLGEAASIMFMGRLMRSKPFLKFMTQPQLTSREMRRARKAGIDFGKETRNVELLRLREVGRQIARQIMSLQFVEGVDQNIIEPIKPLIQQGAQAAGPVIEEATQAISQQLGSPPPQQTSQVQVPDPATANSQNALRIQELNKLFGISP
jgi:hypothetical protein